MKGFNMRKTKKSSVHNGIISVWKFLFALLILAHHCTKMLGENVRTLFAKGAIGVEFFFIVSGFLMAKKVYSEEKKRDKRAIYTATYDFIFNKIKSFYPYLLFSFAIFFLIGLIVQSKSIGELVLSLVDLTLLQQAGLKDTGFIIGAWYLSAMILGELLIYPIFKKLKKNYSCFLAPLIVIFFGGWFIHSVPSIRNYINWTGIMYVGLARSIVELSLGIVAYELCERFKKINFTKFGSILLSFIEVSCFLIVIVVNSIIFRPYNYDWLFIILLTISIVIAFSEKTYFYQKCNNKFFYFLEKLSLPLYLNNFVFINIFNSSLSFDLSYTQKFIFVFIATILLSIIELYLMKYLKMIFSKVFQMLKKLIIVS